MKPIPRKGICNAWIKACIARLFQFKSRLVHLPIMCRWMVIEVKVLSVILLGSSWEHFTQSLSFSCCNSPRTHWDSWWASSLCWDCWRFNLSNTFSFCTLSSSCRIFPKSESVVEWIELVVNLKIWHVSVFYFLYLLCWYLIQLYLTSPG